MKTIRIISLLLFSVLAQEALGADSRTGRVVWWGQDVFRKQSNSGHTNGVIESGGEILTNVVAIAAGHSQALLLKSDGTVFSCGLNMYGGQNVPSGLSNVASVAMEGNSYWAIRRDGTVAQWGDERDDENVVSGLSNITAVAWAGYRSYLALRTDGTVLGFRLDTSGPFLDPTTSLPARDQTRIRMVRVGGQVLSNVVGMASMQDTPLILKSNGTVFRLGFQTPGKPPAEPVVTQVDERTFAIDLGGESWQTPYQYTTADLVMAGGKALSNVTALARGGADGLAVKSDGTVFAWGYTSRGQIGVPPNVRNVIAVVGDGYNGLALKRDGTVAAWGDNSFGQKSAPTGLRNVVAIATDGWFSLALTTGAIPSSVYIRPDGH